MASSSPYDVIPDNKEMKSNLVGERKTRIAREIVNTILADRRSNIATSLVYAYHVPNDLVAKMATKGYKVVVDTISVADTPPHFHRKQQSGTCERLTITTTV